jgi:hypothetical protein
MKRHKKLTPQERERREARRKRRIERAVEETRQVLASILKQDRKRRHHVVWRHYIDGWADADGRVWCQHRGSRFKSATEKVGLINDFYRLKQMGSQELGWIQVFIDRMTDPRDQAVARGWIPMFHDVFTARERFQRAGIKDAEIEEAMEIMISNSEENMHGYAEAAVVPLLEKLRAGDATLLENDDAYFNFARFMGLQFFRTPSAAAKVIPILGEIPNFDPSAAWGLIRTLFATNIGKALFVSRNETTIRFLECDPAAEFVTGDQPVLNLRKTEGLELFYPLTPRLAVRIDADAGSRAVLPQTSDPDDVHRYNVMIRDAAMHQVYAASDATLDKLFGKGS